MTATSGRNSAAPNHGVAGEGRAAVDTRLPVRWRLPVLAAAGLALLGGLYAALVLLGAPVPPPPAPVEEVHGPVMVFGFVGTLIALERAVALAASGAWPVRPAPRRAPWHCLPPGLPCPASCCSWPPPNTPTGP